MVGGVSDLVAFFSCPELKPVYLNAAALRQLLLGQPGAYRDAVLLNSAAALLVAGQVEDWLEGVEEAAEAIDKGLAKGLLDCWIDTVQ